MEIILSRLRVKKNLADYNTLINYIKKNHIYLLDGDVVEIGAMMGGGTKKLAQFFERYNKQIITIDLFAPGADNSTTLRGESLSQFYEAVLGKRKMKDVFRQNTQGLKNLKVYTMDSRYVDLTPSTKLCFSFIDGNHSPEYVKNDFNLVWRYTVPGGVVVFDDYEGDMPETTRAIENVIKAHKIQIEKVDIILKKRLIFIKKKIGDCNGFVKNRSNLQRG